eukprot:TRINITY_DN5088_c0_g1_i6.p1 TRINITY_DN5088_c0_g1~~TRINITY_DN5088_c0_g1_i6.p1  ORF type:complete len:1270 (+),score=233.21 TRINITY_DN5088_c0_g1_i6:49-3858(+)
MNRFQRLKSASSGIEMGILRRLSESEFSRRGGSLEDLPALLTDDATLTPRDDDFSGREALLSDVELAGKRKGISTDPTPRRSIKGHTRSGSDSAMLGKTHDAPRTKKSGTHRFVQSLSKVRTGKGRRLTEEMTGMRTSEAIRILSDELNKLATSQDNTIPQPTLKTVFQRQPVQKFFVIFISTSVLFLMISAILEGQLRVGIEALILFISLVFTLYFEVRELQIQRSEPLNKLRSIIIDLNKFAHYRTGDIYHHGVSKTQSADLFATLRDGRWITLPSNLLVEGDMIEVCIGDVFPCDCVSVDTSLHVPKNEVFQGADSDTSQKVCPDSWADRSSRIFECKATPVIDNMKHVLNMFTNNGHPPTPLDRFYDLMQKKLRQTLFFTLASTVLVNILRYSFSPRSHEWTEMLVQRPIYGVLPVLPLTLPLFLPLLRAFGNARLLALAEEFQNKPPPNPEESSSESSGDEFDAEEVDLPPPSSDFLTMDKILGRFWALLIGRSYCLSRTLKPLETLGSITALTYHDKRGILSAGDAVIEKAVIWSKGLNSMVTWDFSVDPEDHATLRFDDAEWDRFLESLKPLGLSCLMNNLCSRPDLSILIEDMRRYSARKTHDAVYKCEVDCTCPLPRAIGFADDTASLFTAVRDFIITVDLAEFHGIYENFENSPRQDVRFNPPPLVPYSASTMVMDQRNGGYQLFTRGSPDIVLALCTHTWDGNNVIPIDESTRQKLVDSFKNWRDKKDLVVVALSYKPISQAAAKVATAINPDKNSMVVKLSPFEYDLVNCTFRDVDKLQARESAGRSAEDDIVVSLHQQQVLTGLVALKFPPAKEVQDFVNILHNAGIRFVYFSPSNPMKTLAFGERLGLETDWNCYINLGAKVNQEPQELWHEKTRLPRGVENVRKHIDEVDNLPLLIQLFSGCTPSSTKEMIDIYQEHGDVVCHIGSSLRVENLAIFAKADISIAVSPMFPSRCQHQPVNPFLNTLGTHHHHHSSRPCHESISSRLTTLSAFLTFPEYVTYDDLLELMRECRHILTNIKQSLVFILASHYFLSMTLLISFCALSPPIMHGYQLLWLMWVIVPALSVSFLSSSTEPDIMYLMPAKNTDEIEDISRFVVYFLMRFGPTVFVVLWIFVCTLWVFWPDATFGSIFGSVDDNEIYDTDEYWAALNYAQNITLFFVVLYIVTMSMGFLHRIHSIAKIRPYDNRHWVAASITWQVFCWASQPIYHIPHYISVFTAILTRACLHHHHTITEAFLAIFFLDVLLGFECQLCKER